MYFGIYAENTGLLDCYIQAKGYLEIEDYIRELNCQRGNMERYFQKLAIDLNYKVKCHACHQLTDYPVYWKTKPYEIDCLLEKTKKPINQLVISLNEYLEAETRRQQCMKEKFNNILNSSRERMNSSHSKFIGEPGERRVSKLKVENIMHMTFTVDKTGGRAEKALVLFTDEQNNIYKWNTNNTQIIPDSNEVAGKKSLQKTEPEKYEPYYLAFTVKAHTEYKGLKQTVIERVSTSISQTRMKEVFRMLKEQY